VRNNAVSIYFTICYPCNKFNIFKLKGFIFFLIFQGDYKCCQKSNSNLFSSMTHFHKIYYIPNFDTNVELTPTRKFPENFNHFTYSIQFDLLDNLIREGFIISGNLI
jgi:hypothetical protein